MMMGFRAGAPLTERGRKNWFHADSYNCVYDCWGAPGGILRGLFEYDYRSDSLRIRPHIPDGISRYIQKAPVHFGKTKIYITVTGSGAAKSAVANGKRCDISKDGWVKLKNPDAKAGNLLVEVVCGTAKARGAWKPGIRKPLSIPDNPDIWTFPPEELHPLDIDFKKVLLFYKEMVKAGLQDSYEAEMARTALELIIARHERRELLKSGKLVLPDIKPMKPAREDVVTGVYLESARKIAGGLADRFTGKNLWKEAVDPAVIEIAGNVKLVVQE
jgi:hypothetical protein